MSRPLHPNCHSSTSA